MDGVLTPLEMGVGKSISWQNESKIRTGTPSAFVLAIGVPGGCLPHLLDCFDCRRSAT